MSATLPRVFISYQRSDERFAGLVREHLVAHGVTTWMDQYDIPVGAYWPDEIDKGLATSDIVVGILSSDSVASRNVKNEWDWALQRDKPLLLLMTRFTEIPHRYVSINYIDAMEDQQRALVDLLRALGVAAAPAPAEPVAVVDVGTTPMHVRRSSVPRGSEPLLVGREREQAALREVVDGMLAGHGALVLVGGEAGIGKTTLTNWLAWVAQAAGAVFLAGGCYDLSTMRPYGPWTEIIWGWPTDAGLPQAPDALRGAEGFGAARSQAALFDLVATFLAEASAACPIVLLLEDLHWADQATLDLLRALVRPVAGLPIVLAATYRDDEVTRRHPLAALLPGLAREPHTHRISLQRLAIDDTRRLIDARYPLPEADSARLVVYIQQLTEGNPFFAGEVLRALQEADALVRDVEHWQLVRLEQVHVPSLVRQVIDGRLARLGDDARRLLEVAAVIGHEVPVDIWVEVSGASDENLADTLERATEARIVEELPGGGSFRFTHALIRETLYEGVVSLRRRPWHRRVAEALIALPQPDPDRVAFHLEQANDPRRVDWLVRAGDRAQQRFAWRMAAERFDRAAELLHDDPDRASQRGWLLFRTGLLIRNSDHARSLTYLDEAEHVATALGEPVLAGLARAHAGMVRGYDRDVRQGLQELEAGVLALEQLDEANRRLLQEVTSDFETILGVQGRGTLALRLAEIGRFRDGQALLDGWDARARERSPDAQRAAGVIAAYLGQPDLARRAFHRSRAVYLARNDQDGAGNDVFHELLDVQFPYAADELTERRELGRTLQELWTDPTDPSTSAVQTRAVAALECAIGGDWQQAVEWLDQFRQQSRYWMTPFDSWRLLLARQRGETELGWETIRQALPDGPATEPGERNFSVLADLQRLAIDLALDAADLALARTWLDACDRLLDWSDAVLGRAERDLLWARYYRLAGDMAAAQQHAQQALTHATDPCQPLALIAARRVLGALAVDQCHVDIAEAHLQHALAMADACAAPFERALTLLTVAELDVARCDTGAALATLSDVRVICEPLEARPTLERVAALEKRLADRGVA